MWAHCLLRKCCPEQVDQALHRSPLHVSIMDCMRDYVQVVSAIQWLPHRKGVVAVACTEALSHSERVARAGRPTNAHILIWNFKVGAVETRTCSYLYTSSCCTERGTASILSRQQTPAQACTSFRAGMSLLYASATAHRQAWPALDLRRHNSRPGEHAEAYTLCCKFYCSVWSLLVVPC
jgi:hypothetical protein